MRVGNSSNKNSEKVLSQKPVSTKATRQVTLQQRVGEGTETILQFIVSGKWYHYSSLNLDYVDAGKEEGISEQERMKRAMDLYTRQFMDRYFNEDNKKQFKETHNWSLCLTNLYRTNHRRFGGLLSEL